MLCVLRQLPPHYRQASTTLVPLSIRTWPHFAVPWGADYPSYITKTLSPTWDPLEHAWRLIILCPINSTHHIVQSSHALVSAHVVQIRRNWCPSTSVQAFFWGVGGKAENASCTVSDA